MRGKLMRGHCREIYQCRDFDAGTLVRGTLKREALMRGILMMKTLMRGQ